jgi:1,4-alpha-glucan branching enzyme
MHDTLNYFSSDPIFRSFQHGKITFGIWYAYAERFILPLSHDEVVHLKKSLLSKMPGDRWQMHANVRALYAHMWAHPGKKLLFMGLEFAQWQEWSHERSLDWHLLEDPAHSGVQSLVRDLNRAYREHPALWQLDHEPAGFWWIEANDAANNVVAFCRAGEGPVEERDLVVCVLNLATVPREDYRVGLPRAGRWVEAVNTDSTYYGGSDKGNYGGVEAEAKGWHDQPYSAEVTLPPLGAVWLVPGEDG